MGKYNNLLLNKESRTGREVWNMIENILKEQNVTEDIATSVREEITKDLQENDINNISNYRKYLPVIIASIISSLEAKEILTEQKINELYPDLSEEYLLEETEKYINRMVDFINRDSLKTSFKDYIHNKFNYFGYNKDCLSGDINSNYSLAAFGLESYYGCDPKVYISVFKEELNNCLFPYSLPEIREIEKETNKPKNFNPLNEVYVIKVSFRHSKIKLKDNKLPALIGKKRNLYCNEYSQLICRDIKELACENNSFEFDDINSFIFTQPQWEGIKKRYELSNVYYHYAIVFKARYINLSNILYSNTSKRLCKRFIYIKSFCAAYCREFLASHIESVIAENNINISDLIVSTDNKISKPTWIYIPSKGFSITLGEIRDNTYTNLYGEKIKHYSQDIFNPNTDYVSTDYINYSNDYVINLDNIHSEKIDLLKRNINLLWNIYQQKRIKERRQYNQQVQARQKIYRESRKR